MGCCFYFVLTLVLVKNFGDWGLVEIAVHVAKLDLQRGSFLFLFLKFFFTLLFAPFHPLFLPPLLTHTLGIRAHAIYSFWFNKDSRMWSTSSN